MKVSLLIKECRLSRSSQPGIIHYYNPKSINPFVITSTVPVSIKPKLSLISSYVYLPRGHSNNLKLIIMGMLEVAFDRTHVHILNKIKQFVYDDNISFTYLNKNQLPEKTKNHYNNEHLKKVLMQFFNIMMSHPSPTAHLYHFVQAYPQILFILQILFRKILLTLGLRGAQFLGEQLQTPIILQTLSKYFECLFEKAQDNVYWIARKAVFLQDKSSIYKNKFEQQGCEKMMGVFNETQWNDQYEERDLSIGITDKQFHSKGEQTLSPHSWAKPQSNSRVMLEQSHFSRAHHAEQKKGSKAFVKKDSIGGLSQK